MCYLTLICYYRIMFSVPVFSACRQKENIRACKENIFTSNARCEIIEDACSYAKQHTYTLKN